MHTLLACIVLFAQSPAFEVASIKVNASGLRGGGMPPIRHGQFTAQNVTLKDLVVEAYQLQDFQVSGGPAWIASEHFDVNAKAAGGKSEGVHEMLQALLADRFQLKLRHETKDAAVYAMVPAKGGLKLVPSATADCDAVPADRPCGGFRVSQRRHVEGMRASMPELSNLLSTLLTRVVKDNTGLTGRYDFKLDWTPNETQSKGLEVPDPTAAEEGGASIFAAMQEQLGLKLEAKRSPIDILVIERAEKLAAN